MPSLDVLLIALGGSITSAALSFFLWSRRPWGDAAGGDAIRMTYPKSMRAGVWSCALAIIVLFAGVTLFVGVPPDDRLLCALVAGALEVLLCLVLLEVSGVVHEISPAGFLASSPWRGRRFLPWPELTRLRFDAPSQTWLLASSTGDQVSIPQFFSGLSAFALYALQFARPEVLDADPATRAHLARLELEG